MIKLQSTIWWNLFFTLTLVVVANCISLSFLPHLWSSMDIVEIQNTNNGSLETNFKTKRFNRSTSVIYGTLTLTDDIYNIDYDAKFFFSSLGNNQYIFLPYMWRREPLCNFVNNYFQQYVQADLENVSDVPKAVENQPLCPLYIKNKYTIRGFYVREDILPHFFQPGTYKCLVNFYKVDVAEIQQTFIVLLKLY